MSRGVLRAACALLVACACSATYTTISSTQSPLGWTASLALNAPGPYGNDVNDLSLSVYYETDTRVRVRLTPASAQTDLTFSELPNSLFAVPTPVSGSTQNRKYKVAVSGAGEPFAISVLRADGSQSAVWQTADSAASPLVFASQFLQLTNQFPYTEPYVFGLGERDANLRMRFDSPYVLFSQDVAPVNSTLNQYGVHPFYVHVDAASGEACGVLLWNAHAMEVVLSHSGALQYKVVGGVLDFFVFLGPTPGNVIAQYTELVGYPRLPPLWSLGFHQCRWGYKTANETRLVVENYTSNQLPLDAIWNDIDYLHHYNDFTLDPYRFSPADVASFDQWLASTGKHHVYIVDPAIPVADYAPYHTGLDQNIFALRNNQSAPVWSKVWPPQPVVFPDFTNPASAAWWQQNIQTWFALGVKADGLWIDMNEPSNFCNGEYPIGCRVVIGPPYSENTTDIPLPDQQEMVKWGMFVLQERARTDALPASPPIPLATPPFIPGQATWGLQSLDDSTLAMNARQNLSSLHYNTHSLYGYFESIATLRALVNLNQNRPFLLSRSTFVGSGKYTAHWTGDNSATWESMAISIPHILSFSLFGIPMVGADICGFLLDTNVELCARWMQLGTLYPFSRNHNMWNTIAQEPYALGDTVLRASRASLTQRYSILPYLYTALAAANVSGDTVARPLFFEYTQDANTYELDTQFLLGSALLVCPVLLPGKSSVTAYLPNDDWFFFDSGARLSVFNPTTRVGGTSTWSVPLDAKLPLVVRGGYIVPSMNRTYLSTVDTMSQSDYCLTVAMQSPRVSTPNSSTPASSSTLRAAGQLYHDDGVSLDPLNMGVQNFALWQMSVDEVVSSTWSLRVARAKGVMPVAKQLVRISVYGVVEPVFSAWLGSDTSALVPFVYDNATQTLQFYDLALPLPSPTDSAIRLSWTAVPPAPAPTLTPTPTPTPGSSAGLTSEQIVWIVAGCVAGAVLALAACCYCRHDADGYSELESALVLSASQTHHAVAYASSAARQHDAETPQNFLNPSRAH